MTVGYFYNFSRDYFIKFFIWKPTGTGHMPDPLGTGETPGGMCRRASYVRSIGFLFFSRGTLILESYAVHNDRKTML